MYEYLNKFKSRSGDEKYGNSFYLLEESEVMDAEKYLGYLFPSELKQFYKEIGYGYLTNPKAFNDSYSFSGTNRINSPHMIIDMLQNGAESGLISPSVHEDLEPGDLPVFEIADSSSFMIMKALSDNPNAVWYMGSEKIEDSFARFIYRLYHESPTYYADNW